MWISLCLVLPKWYTTEAKLYSQAGSYIEHASGWQDQLEFRNGLYVLKLWIPRDQGMDFHWHA